ncbi:unnamed protein product [Gongylonema pulchrum]|uniref:Metalloendopeptidase n=1 Tax=Gongylonema pulchrum TaxID=637853 RepID=A0A183DBD6_9BILA|nr:unnamed protein product [Gongylonema pulchrum]
MAHELGHALGFLHTHNRADRDQYISVNFTNVKDSLTGNFKKVSRTINYNYGLPYDYGSVMHYSKKS